MRIKQNTKNSYESLFKIYFSNDELDKIQKAKIMIVGCGGLGSNIATILVRTGFVNLILIDYDRVEIKNLNRQNYFIYDIGKSKINAIKTILFDINPNINLITIRKKINKNELKKLIKKYLPDIIVEAVDNENTKAKIFETALEMGRTIIAASGIAGYGDIEKIRIIRQKKYTIIGDFKKTSSHTNRLKTKSKRMPLAPKVTAIASMQADEVLRRVIEEEL